MSAPHDESAPPASSTPPPTPEPAPPPALSRQATIGVVVVAVLALAALFWPRGDGSEPLPPGSLLSHDGTAVELAAAADGATGLVHFWSTWCIPCLEELPQVYRLAVDRPDLDIVPIVVADEREKVEMFLSESMQRGPDDQLYDEDWTIAKRFRTSKLPETHLFVDGRVVHTFVGVTNWDDPAVRATIDEEIAAARAAR